VGEVKGLVNPEDLSIQSLLAELKPESYTFPKDYLSAAERAHVFVCKEIEFVPLDIDLSYWLSPREILTEKMADDEDLAIFLCSLLSGLGDQKASVAIAELEDLSTHAFVMTEWDQSMLLLDPAQKHPFRRFFGPDARVLSAYSFEGNKLKRFLYKFNRAEFKQFL